MAALRMPGTLAVPVGVSRFWIIAFEFQPYAASLHRLDSAHPGPQDVRHASGIFLGLLADVLGQHFGFLGNRRQLQGVQRLRLLLLAQRGLLRQMVLRSAAWSSIGRGGSVAAEARLAMCDARLRPSRIAHNISDDDQRAAATATRRPLRSGSILFLRNCCCHGDAGDCRRGLGAAEAARDSASIQTAASPPPADRRARRRIR